MWISCSVRSAVPLNTCLASALISILPRRCFKNTHEDGSIAVMQLPTDGPAPKNHPAHIRGLSPLTPTARDASPWEASR